MERYDEPREPLERAVVLAPDDAYAPGNLATLYEKTGRVEDAKQLRKETEDALMKGKGPQGYHWWVGATVCGLVYTGGTRITSLFSNVAPAEWQSSSGCSTSSRIVTKSG